VKNNEMCEISGFLSLPNGWECYILVAVDQRCPVQMPRTETRVKKRLVLLHKEWISQAIWLCYITNSYNPSFWLTVHWGTRFQGQIEIKEARCSS